ncbi:MAG: PD-(D/E)XK nuclease family protein [Bacteroidota bacterium]
MDHLSSSQITLYLQCALKYKFQYVENRPKPFRPSALAFGSALHSALDWLNKERMKGRTVSLEELHRIYDADWFTQKVDAEIRFKDGEQEMALAALGKEFLTLYLEEPVKKIAGAEIHFNVPLADPFTGEALGMNLEGFLDLVEADGTIVEFKTSAATLSASDLDGRLQFTAYSYAYEFLHRKPPKEIKVVNFVKAKKPRIAIAETRRTKADYAGFVHVAREVLKGINAEVFPPSPSFMCKECEYASICPLWQRKVVSKDAEAIPATVR